MKFALPLLVFSALLAAATWPCAADDLDELLSSSATSTDTGALVSPENLESQHAVVADPNRQELPGEAKWNAEFDEPAAPEAAHGAGPTKHVGQHKHATDAGISMVPEPSAVALGALALVYFLVFGRRTRWG